MNHSTPILILLPSPSDCEEGDDEEGEERDAKDDADNHCIVIRFRHVRIIPIAVVAVCALLVLVRVDIDAASLVAVIAFQV